MFNNKSIIELANGLNNNEFTSVDLVEHCLERIAMHDQSNQKLNSIVEIEPDAIYIARQLDKERMEKGPRSLLHGIPIAVKDNISTKDTMHTTAGSLALNDLITPFDSYIIEKLKEAGAIIMAKANLSEFAYFMSRENMPSGYSSRGGQVVHPYVPGFDPSGSSSGSAVAVAGRIFPVTIGTETNGSLTSPSKSNAIVTIKPTIGLVSRHGIIPISHHQDMAGPMAKSVEDCAILLEILAGKDEKDKSTMICPKDLNYQKDFIDSLDGLNIGILEHKDMPFNEKEKQLIQNLKQYILELNGTYKEISLDSSRYDSGHTLQHEFKNGLNRYLASVRGYTNMTSLTDIIEFNKKHKETCLKYGQSLLLESDNFSGNLNEPNYIQERMNVSKYCKNTIDSLLVENELDCIITMRNSGQAPTAGYPILAIPADTIDESNIQPVSFFFVGSAFSEHTLIHVAHAIEKKLNLNCCPSWIQ